jgi:hypothetical protein
VPEKLSSNGNKGAMELIISVQWRNIKGVMVFRLEGTRAIGFCEI